jgi:hypothetical protein
MADLGRSELPEPQMVFPSMVKSVFCFEEIFSQNIFMRDVTVIAIGPLSMGAVHPRMMIRIHNVAVDTCHRRNW